jgi:hypothetical protein
MQPEIWIGTVEIMFANPDAPNAMKRGFTVVTTWASTPEEYRQKCNRMLESYGWKLLAVEKANPVLDGSAFSDEVEDMLERTRANPNAIIFGTLHIYPVV